MRRARKAALGLLVAAGVLGTAELGLRGALPPADEGGFDAAFGGGGTLADPDYGWRLAPGAPVHDPVAEEWAARWGRTVRATDRISQHGFRDTELAAPRPAEQRRVLCLGDSSVYGSGVAAEERYSERLERALDPDDRGLVEVINGGTPGWSTWQSLQQLEDSLHLGLDALVVYNMNSDIMPAEGVVTDDAWFAARRALRVAGPVQRLALVRALRGVVRPPTLPRGEAGARRVSPARYADNLRRLDAIAAAHGMGLVFVVPPQPLDLGELDPAWRARAAPGEGEPDGKVPGGRAVLPWRLAMAQVAEERGRPLVDGPALFHDAHRSGAHQGADALFVDAIHPSAAGHRLLADAILAPLRAELEGATGRSRGEVPAWVGAPVGPVEEPVAPNPTGPVARPPSGGGPPGGGPPGGGPPGGGPPGGGPPGGGPPGGGPPGALAELPCGGGAPPEGWVAVPVQIEGAAAGPALVTVLQPGLSRATERGLAWCPLRGGALHLPRDLGPVRLVALDDRDGDGPCPRDRVGPAAASFDPASTDPASTDPASTDPASTDPASTDPASTDPASTDPASTPPQVLVLGTEPGAWGAPFGLPWAASPLLALAAEHRWQGRLGLLADPSARALLDPAALARELRRPLAEVAPDLHVVDVLDLPDAPLSSYAALAIVAPLDGDLPARALAASGRARQGGWTDPTGLVWTVTWGTPAAAPAPGGALSDGEGWRRAESGEGPALPAELEAR